MDIIGSLCITLAVLLAIVPTVFSGKEFELSPQDGWYNNLIHPDWGAVDGHLLRRSKVAFSDGVYEPSGKDRPNPLTISKEVHDGPAGLGSLRNRTAFLVYFGQQVVEEILDAQRPGCPREFFNIPVPPGHDYDPERKGNIELPLHRTRFDQRTGMSPNNPRQQLNEITPYIDGGLFYGTSKAWTDSLREFKDGPLRGRLAALDPYADIKDSFPAKNTIRLPMANPPPPREHVLKPVNRFWRLGNPRGNENPFLLAFGVLWFRWHNYMANEIAIKNPDYTDEEVFNEARKFVIAIHQKIVMYDWLPTWLGLNSTLQKIFEIPRYDLTDPKNSYNPNVHPGIAAEFQSAAMRFGHTLVTPGTWIRDKTCDFKKLQLNIPGSPSSVHALRTCNSYWNPQEFLAGPNANIDELLMGLTSTLSEREDHIVVPDLRKHLFGPLEFSRRDLIAINIQRARDHGLPDYNSIREAYGLPRRQTWEEINNATYDNGTLYMEGPINNLRRVYGNASKPDNVDLFPAGLLETTPNGVGETFRTIILDQFLRIRQSDRFWFENTKNGLFTADELEQIRNVTIYEIVTKVTHIGPADIQRNPFLLTNSPCPQPKQLVADGYETFSGTDNTLVIEQCTPLKHYDYFSGSEVSFALTFFFLGLCIAIAFGVLFVLARYGQRRKMQAIRPNAPILDDPDTFLTTEWTGPKDGDRNIRVKFDLARKKIHITDRIKKPLRMIDLRQTTENVHVLLSDDKQKRLMSIRVPGEIDLVLRFEDERHRGVFVQKLETFLKNIMVNCEMDMIPDSLKILKNAETKENRKKLLDKVFRAMCLQAFGASNEEAKLRVDSKRANEVAKIQLTRTEFADALGLKTNSLFVRNMFLMVDKDKNGFVSFQEFMDIFVILARGNAAEKAKLLFNMNDVRGRGYLTKTDFGKMIKSMLDLSDGSLEDDQVKQLINTLYSQAGLRSTFVADYSFEREDHGLRRIAGYGVTVTRGAASVMMWTYSSLLVTMSKNTITFLRETFLHRFIPFDSAGIFLVLIVIIMYVFALPYARRHVFGAFWITHTLYVLLYAFMILHGSGRLVQEPLTHYFLLGPLILFILDKVVSISRRKIPIQVKKVELLPSDVTAFTFKRPLNFDFKSGQWVRISCQNLGEHEYHPFTLTSAPHEENLSLHIRALGPWTMNLRKTFDINNREDKLLPMLYMDGPFGEGHQDWYRFKVSVLVGGGIGVTPFASILKDIVHKSKMGTKFPCEKVYFLWVTKTQRQFEWLTDIIREVESTDHKNLVTTHIFITQFQQKYDLRTTMLYICERHFQKIAGRSLFTGLKAITHFGRPEFVDFLHSLHDEHPDVNQIGVFSCGPPPMTLAVDRACSKVKQLKNFPSYQHHFENF